MLPWKPRKRQILPVSQNLSLVYFSPAKFRLVSSNLSLAIIWQMIHTQKLPKLCSATLKYKLQLHTSSVIFMSSLHKEKKKKWENVYSTVLLAPGGAINIK